MSVLRFNQSYLQIYNTVSFLFRLFFAALRPSLDHYRGNSLSHPCQSLHFNIFPPEVLPDPGGRMGP